MKMKEHERKTTSDGTSWKVSFLPFDNCSSENGKNGRTLSHILIFVDQVLCTHNNSHQHRMDGNEPDEKTRESEKEREKIE